jgi:hypothetical protein
MPKIPPTPRVQYLASQALPAAGAYTTPTQYALPQAAEKVTFYVSYARGGSGGQAQHTVWLGNGTEFAQAPNYDFTWTALQGPATTSASEIQYAIVVEVAGGVTHIGLASAEVGNTGSPGTMDVYLSVG